MAKVTMIIEDIINAAGEPRLRVSVESSNKDSKDYTQAETVAEQLYAILISEAQSISVLSSDKDEKSQLN
jgi:hypothetical protein